MVVFAGFKEIEGVVSFVFHKKVEPTDDAVKMVLSPLHKEVSPEMETVGGVPTITVALFAIEHSALVTVAV